MITRVVFAGAILVGLASVCAAQSSSANYTLTCSVVASGGNASSSAGYSLGSTLGQPSAIGCSSSPLNNLEAGFWYQKVLPPGDVTGDGVVNVLDMIAVRGHLYEDPASDPEVACFDLTDDGKINVLDMIFVRNHLGLVAQ